MIRCRACGLPSDSPIHVGGHPTRCHKFVPREPFGGSEEPTVVKCKCCRVGIAWAKDIGGGTGHSVTHGCEKDCPRYGECPNVGMPFVGTT